MAEIYEQLKDDKTIYSVLFYQGEELEQEIEWEALEISLLSSPDKWLVYERAQDILRNLAEEVIDKRAQDQHQALLKSSAENWEFWEIGSRQLLLPDGQKVVPNSMLWTGELPLFEVEGGVWWLASQQETVWIGWRSWQDLPEAIEALQSESSAA